MKDNNQGYEFLKATLWKSWGSMQTAQKQGVPPPPLQRPAPEGACLIDLVPPDQITLGNIPLLQAINNRRSRREYSEDPLSLEELSFLLWATQGVQKTVLGGVATRRTVPSGGSRHPFETYLVVQRVAGLEPGLYRFLAVDYRLCFLTPQAALPVSIDEACSDFSKGAAVVFIWAAVPARTQWRYGPLSPRLIALDAGHVCQNLYLACEAIGAGTCAVGAYDQEKMDRMICADGEAEFVVYSAPVGKKKSP